MSDVVIQTHNLSKRYRLGENVFSDLSQQPRTNRLLDPFRRSHRTPDPNDSIWAIKDLSFEVKQGEVVGVIGGNGAGKSTLLKILSRITHPTTGHASLTGRVGSLLEVGTGFHPELTGRENIYLNGAILGMKRKDISKRFDEIIEFAEISRFIDTPVKRYSSGMYTRLAFSVAAHFDPEILIIDEVLAVGDAVFQQKCLGKMGDISQQGRTILFVSHRLEIVRRLCNPVLLLDHGKALQFGDPDSVIHTYLSSYGLVAEMPDRGPEPDNPMRLRSARLLDGSLSPCSTFQRDDTAYVEVHFDINRPIKGVHIFSRIINIDDVTVISTGDCDTEGDLFSIRHPGSYRSRFKIPVSLLNEGEYTVYFSLSVPYGKVYDLVHNALRFSIAGNDLTTEGFYLQKRPGVLFQNISWDTEIITSSDTEGLT